ncbi:MAG: hypothetical protein WC878_07005 [Candidatus Paceibacterota bacterium]|jgi:hypothetical protein
MKKKIYISPFFVLLFFMSYLSAVATMNGDSSLLLLIVLSGVFTPFFAQKETVVQMFLPLLCFSLSYTALSLYFMGLMQWMSGGHFFSIGEGMGIFLFFSLSFIGGLAGIVAQEILSRFFVFKK